MNKVKMLESYTHDHLISVCAWCGSVRDNNNHWKKISLEKFNYLKVSFTHGICPDCSKKIME